ncbi:hypothetical protein [Caballeronia sp. RCC_10]|jgi:hypothetical protein|uniref:hypothetical protein n=1 Tax=Caballeronia sp. RCC_10 TaxID=3239227 RepID=UPI003525C3FF
MINGLRNDAEEFDRRLAQDATEMVPSRLAAGRPIYYLGEDSTPPDVCLKIYPDGRREFVRFDEGKERTVLNRSVTHATAASGHMRWLRRAALWVRS